MTFACVRACKRRCSGYREELFPGSTYRRAYDRLVQDHGTSSGGLEYLRLLKLTAELGINAVEGLPGEMLGPDAPPWRAECP
jgi:hypothetical protein